MQKLLASDVIYETVVRPEINGVLANNGIEDSDVPKSVFLPDGTKWLEESSVSAALGAISGASARNRRASTGSNSAGSASTAANSAKKR